MRVLTVSLMGWLAAAGAAEASSIVTLTRPAASPTPSITTIGSSEPAAYAIDARQVEAAGERGQIRLGRSMIAFGPDALPRAGGAVAAIGASGSPGESRARPVFPLIIRGGISHQAAPGTAPRTVEIPSPEPQPSQSRRERRQAERSQAAPEPQTPAAAPTAQPQ